MSADFESIPDDRRNEYLNRTMHVANVAALIVANELQPDQDNDWYVPTFIKGLSFEGQFPAIADETDELSLQEQMVHELSQPRDFDIAAELSAELAKQASVHDWLKRSAETDDTQEAIYTFMLRKVYTEAQKQQLMDDYASDPSSIVLEPRYYDQIMSIINEDDSLGL